MDKGAYNGLLFFVVIPAMQNDPLAELKEVTANDTMIWEKRLPDYPSSLGWSLSYSLRGPSSSDFSASPSGTGYQVSTPSPSQAGDYSIQGYVTKGTERHTIYSGTLTVLPDLSAVTSSTYDGRSQVKRTLDAINAVIENRASKSDQEIIVDGTRLNKIPHLQLLQLRGVYARLYWKEQNPGKIGPAVNVSFRGRF